VQPGINAMVEQFSQMGAMFLEPYKVGIVALDLDNISVYACSPNVRFHLKINLFVRGITKFLNTLLA